MCSKCGRVCSLLPIEEIQRRNIHLWDGRVQEENCSPKGICDKTMLKKLTDNKKSNPKQGFSGQMALPSPPDPIAQDLKKTGSSKGSNWTALHRKLFQKGGSADQKALTEDKANSRTLAMVLQNERELMDRNLEYEALLEEKEHEVKKLTGLCLKQRKEIKKLKDLILFLDEKVTLKEKGYELIPSLHKQEKGYELIPSLQKQASLLTGQIQCLAEDLVEVKAGSSRFDGGSSSRRILFKEASNSLKQEYSSGEPLSTQHDPFGDLNPCVTPSFS